MSLNVSPMCQCLLSDQQPTVLESTLSKASVGLKVTPTLGHTTAQVSAQWGNIVSTRKKYFFMTNIGKNLFS